MKPTIRFVILFGSALAAHDAEPVELAGQKLNLSAVVQAYVEDNSVADSDDNPDNQLARLADRRRVLEFRPELRFSNDIIEVRAGPRLRIDESTVSVAGNSARSRRHSAYVNEWRAQLSPHEKLTVSVGREVLLWGPATLYSPSNPFYADNGRANPYLELDASDFFKASYFPAAGWTIGYIDNFSQGRVALPPLAEFSRTRLLKIDGTGANYYWSINYSRSERAGARIGGALQFTVSDALVAYMEGEYLRRQTQYRPVLAANGWQLETPVRPGGTGVGVLGAIYTLESGPTITMEYLRNGQGWSDREYGDFRRVTKQAAEGLEGPLSGQSLQQLARAVEPGSELLARNYLLVQYLHPSLADDLDLTLRATRSVEGKSWRLSATLEQRFARRYGVFAQLVTNEGGSNGEFGRYLRRQVQVGLKAGF